MSGAPVARITDAARALNTALLAMAAATLSEEAGRQAFRLTVANVLLGQVISETSSATRTDLERTIALSQEQIAEYAQFFTDQPSEALQ